jgi:DNA-directed RNA polymerase subunit beta
MLTIKSDDVVGRARAFEAIVKGVDIPEATVPESFKVLVRELNALSLSIDAKGGVYTDDDETGSLKEAEELAVVAGAEVVATSELTKPEGPMEIEEVTE